MDKLAKCIGALVVFIFAAIGSIIFLVFSILASIRGWGDDKFNNFDSYEDD